MSGKMELKKRILNSSLKMDIKELIAKKMDIKEWRVDLRACAFGSANP